MPKPAKALSKGSPEKLTVSQVAKAIDLPAKKWAGNCFAVASKIVKAELIQGIAVYGHFAGEICQRPGSYYERSCSTQHGWVKLHDGRVFDATRWVFEDAEPYLYVGPNNSDYDEGGNDLNKLLRGGPPQFVEGDDTWAFDEEAMPHNVLSHVKKLLRIRGSYQEDGFFTKTQIHWLANVHFDELQPHAETIYQAIEGLGRAFAGFIPYDNRQRAKRLAEGSPV